MNLNQKNPHDLIYIKSNILYLTYISNSLEKYMNIIKRTEVDTIIFDKTFIGNINSLLPNNIKNIIFDDKSLFDNKITELPEGLEKIKFGNFFSQSLDLMPSSLKELEFSQDSVFNCQINDLPCLLEKITFGKYFNMPLDNLPHNLKYLNINSNSFTLELKNLPKNLKYLYMYNSPDYYYSKQINKIPPELKEIQYPWNYGYPIDNLSNSVEIVRISYDYMYKKDIEILYPNKKIIIY